MYSLVTLLPSRIAVLTIAETSTLSEVVLMRSIAGVVAKLTMRVENARSMNRGWYGT